MKKKRTILSIVVTIAVVAIGAFFALKPSPANINQVELDTQVNATGKKCNYPVGCSCSGFKPKTNGEVWEEAYCKNCGHHKKYHKR